MRKAKKYSYPTSSIIPELCVGCASRVTDRVCVGCGSVYGSLQLRNRRKPQNHFKLDFGSGVVKFLRRASDQWKLNPKAA